METQRRSVGQMERQNNNLKTFVNTMAYDDDSEFLNSDNEEVDDMSRDGACSSSSSGIESIDNDDLFNETEVLKFPKKTGDRRMSEISGKVMVQNRRKHGLVEIREHIQDISNQGTINHAQLQTLLSDRNFCFILFNLFDDKDLGILDQQTLFDLLKYWTKANPEEKTKDAQNKLDFIDLIEAITYLVCQDNNVTPEHFHRILSTKGVANKIIRVLNKDNESKIVVDDLMSFIITATRGSQLSAESTERLRKVFSESLGKDKHEISLHEFKKIVPCKDEFFVNRIFNIFDSDQSGYITLAKFIETVNQFSSSDDDSKIEFLFNIYDINGEGVLEESNFREVIKACMKENGMDFDEEELTNLASALFMDGVKDGNEMMTLDDFKEQLQRQEGLVEGLGIMINKWLVPPRPPKEKTLLEKLSDRLPQRYLSKDYWVNNKSFHFFIFVVLLINTILFIHRAFYFRHFSMLSGFTPNPFYLLSRACGRTLLFNSVLILFLVLRNTITLLRKFGLATILPLDNNIYLHKLVGIMIFLQASLHSIMHLCNFAVNVKPNPVKFLQLTYKYWEDYYGIGVPMTLYHVPPGCEIVDSSSSNISFCPPDSMDTPEGVHPDYIYNNGSFLCQACSEDARPWTYVEWIFTMQPHMFGMMHGIANPSGVALITILTVMFVCSLPFVRRRGHFELFYFTHLLYHAYFVLLLVHAPEFWKWFIVVGLIWIVEIAYRILSSLFGNGKTVIKAGVILPSKVTNLIIERPPGFNFSAGDWVFVKIPAVASSEWHPFTISSAPEVSGQFTLHIRGVGQWTNSLYKLFEKEYERQKSGEDRVVSTFDRIQGTVRKKYQSVRTIVNNTIGTNDEDEDDEDNFAKNLQVKSLEERSRERMEKRQEKLRRISRDENDEILSRSLTKVRYLSMKQPKIVKYDSQESLTSDKTDESTDLGFQIVVHDESKSTLKQIGQQTRLEKPLEVYIDGPFGSPSSNIYRAEHAVLVGTGIGITPFASILQSIMHRYWEIKQSCPNCNYRWTNDMEASMFKLKKVDFFWINRDQKSFEWFVNLLSQLEIEQKENGGAMSRFLEMHMYVTSALQRTDMKAVALQLALDILHKKEERDLVTGLKARTNAGRPNWNKVFTKIREERKGQVTVFYCGNPMLGRTLRYKCEEFGFKFRKEVF